MQWDTRSQSLLKERGPPGLTPWNPHSVSTTMHGQRFSWKENPDHKMDRLIEKIRPHAHSKKTGPDYFETSLKTRLIHIYRVLDIP